MTLRVALVAQLTQAKHQETHTSIDNNWFELLSNFDCSVHILPNHMLSAKKLLKTLKPDAFILSGGGDFTFDFANDPRSELEHFILTNYKDTPILGVCRGMQAMHTISGGVLKKVDGHVQKQYSITLGCTTVSQNSYHDYGFDYCTEEYTPLSIANDGVIKAFRHKKYNWLGIMWHPERNNKAQDFNVELINKLFFKVNNESTDFSSW